MEVKEAGRDRESKTGRRETVRRKVGTVSQQHPSAQAEVKP